MKILLQTLFTKSIAPLKSIQVYKIFVLWSLFVIIFHKDGIKTGSQDMSINRILTMSGYGTFQDSH